MNLLDHSRLKIIHWYLTEKLWKAYFSLFLFKDLDINKNTCWRKILRSNKRERETWEITEGGTE